MDQQYHILLVEDSPDDAEIIRYTLTKAEMQFVLTVTDTERGFLEALQRSAPDIVLSDFHLPQFSGRQALELLLRTSPGTPFILVSGAVGDEIAVEMLKTGCMDYVLKDKLTRLPSAIRRAVQEARNEQDRLRAINEMKESEQRFRRIADQSPMLIWMTDTEGMTVYVNATWRAFTGWSLEEEQQRGFLARVHPEDRSRVARETEEALRLRRPVTIEYRTMHHSGQYRWIFDTGVPNYLPNGEFIGFIGSSLDIQDRTEAENRLRESEQKFRSLFDNHSAMKMLLDPENGRIVDANRSASEFYGWSHAELLGMTIFDLNIAPRGEVQGLMSGVVNNQLKHFLVKHRKRDGTVRDMEIYSNPLLMEGRTMLYVIIHDVTDKVRSEEQLRLNNAALDSATNTIVLFDRRGIIVWANRAFKNLTGYAPEEAVGKNPRDLIRSGRQDTEFFRIMWETILGGDVWHGELINRRKDGTEYYEEQTITPLLGPDGAVTHFISIKQDITERRAMQESLRRTTEMLDTFFSQSLDACYFMQFRTPLSWTGSADRDAMLQEVFETGSIAKHNDALLKQYRIDRDVLQAMTLRDMFDGDYAKVSRLLTQLFDAGASYYSTTMWREGDKAEIVVEGNAVCIFDDQRRISGFFGIQRDVTESVKERAELQLNRDRYKKFFEDDMTGDFITKPDGTIVMCNQSFARIFGFSGIEEVLTVKAQSLYADERERIELLEILARDKKVDHYMLHGRRKNGEDFIALMTAIVHTDASGNIVELVGYITDDTRRQEIESQMIQAQKMESIGELASGVAHDFNNILNNILGFSQQLIKYHMDPTRVLRYSDTIAP
ncbi:MAG: PAS domain S-box protein [Bacteroidetes bacterium]|nr:PAS domain S-box protein [Bacteroidota bacterium]